MKKILGLFQRNFDTDGLVRNEIVPGSEWVLTEGVATRKWDGTCCLILGGRLFKRYDAKHGKIPPKGFIPAQEPDPVTGHWPGWLLVSEDKSEDRWHREGFANALRPDTGEYPITGDWTYELVGPKIGGNPEREPEHRLIKHGNCFLEAPRDYYNLKLFFEGNNIEGIVWWRDPSDVDCDKVKIKARDFGIKRRS